MQPTKGWLLGCNNYFMPNDWVIDIDVMSIRWSWGTLLIKLSSAVNHAWFILHIPDKLVSSFWIMYETEGKIQYLLDKFLLDSLAKRKEASVGFLW